MAAGKRCGWCESSELMMQYHDEEWGVPVHDDRKLFEFMVLDAFQAGLSWAIILNKREGFREAFRNFEPERIVRLRRSTIEKLVQNPRIIRNRLKIEATVSNARRFLQVQDEFGSFDRFIWSFVNHRSVQNRWSRLSRVPSRTLLSDAMSKALRERGFKFTGSTICYAFMQAAGLVNDHVTSCFRHDEISALSEDGVR